MQWYLHASMKSAEQDVSGCFLENARFEYAVCASFDLSQIFTPYACDTVS